MEPIADLFQYTDVRVFLRDHYKREKKRRKAFSYRQFALKAGVPHSLYQDVVAGRKRLTDETAAKFAKALGLEGGEREYFTWMVRLQTAPDPEAKAEAFSRLSRFRTRARIHPLEEHQHELFLKWHHTAIREMVQLPDFQEDPSWIRAHLRPDVSEDEIRDSLHLLLHLGLVARDRKGRLIQLRHAIGSDSPMKGAALRTFHRQMIELAGRSLDTFPVPEREVGAVTLCTSRALVERIRERMRIFREEMLALAIDEPGHPEGVWQLNLQIFPLSPPPDTEESR